MSSEQDLRTQRASGSHKQGRYVEKRSEYERDLDRVIYDYYFGRLGQITQVSSGSGRVLLHNRMTHSHKVAQVGRRLVQYLEIDDENGTNENSEGIRKAGGIDPDVVAAAGFLHDTGHPPFGHVAEEELNEIALEAGMPDGFEGNAQTFRIVMSLSTHFSSDRDNGLTAGLDLTRAVTAAFMKYPWDAETGRSKNGPAKKKWGFYECDRAAFESFVRPLLTDDLPTLEAEIMDWADDITYAVHDLQDFYTDGVLPLHRLRHIEDRAHQEPEMNGFWEYAMDNMRRRSEDIPADAKGRTLFAEVAQIFPRQSYSGSDEDRAAVSKLASVIISKASKATSVKPSGRLAIEPDMKFVINVLKQITWYYVIDKPELVSVQIGQRHKVRAVYNGLFTWATGSEPNDLQRGASIKDQTRVGSRRLPADLARYIDILRKANKHEGAYGTHDKNLVRAIIDYIASMTEAEIDDMYLRLTSGGHLSSMVNHRLD